MLVKRKTHSSTKETSSLKQVLPVIMLVGFMIFVPLASDIGAVYADSHIQGCGDQGLQVAIDIGCQGEGNPIMDALGGIVRFLAAGVGLVITLMIVIGAIQYMSSAGNPQGLEAAKKKIFHAVEALLLFIFMTAILNFVIPGGLL